MGVINKSYMAAKIRDELAILFEILERIAQCNLAFSGKLHKLRLRHTAKLRRQTERDRAFAEQFQRKQLRHFTRG